jgi:hypothetical protein
VHGLFLFCQTRKPTREDSVQASADAVSVAQAALEKNAEQLDVARDLLRTPDKKVRVHECASAFIY